MTMSPRLISLLCIATLALAMGIGIAFTSKLVARVEPSPHDLGGATPDLSAVLERIDRLEQRLAEIERQEAAAAATPVNAPRAALPDDTTAELTRRVEQLERVARPRNGDASEDPARVALGQIGQAQGTLAEPTPAQQIAAHQQTILDSTKTEKEKVKALSRLRGFGRDAWSDAVVQEMARIGLGSTDAGIRADVWRHLHSAREHKSMVPSLLLALANDPDATVREEAAETLEAFKDDPAVAQSLQSSAANDADERVRNQAAASFHTTSRGR